MALDGVPVLLTDTAGLRESDDPVEAIGIERAERLVLASDILLWLGAPELRPLHGNLIQLAPKADLGGAVPAGACPVSALTGHGLGELKEHIAARMRDFLPGEDAIVLNRRQAGLIAAASGAARSAARQSDVVIAAEQLRQARNAFDRLTGQAGVEDLLDHLFGRFCLGK
jgi:tRNA modification GTPase